MQKTLNLSKELCTFGWNAYAAMALPGSKLYKDAIINACDQTPYSLFWLVANHIDISKFDFKWFL